MKIFCAGGDRTEFSIAMQAVGYPYRLCSYYYLKEEPRTRALMMECIAMAPESEWIMDSGLFTLMFGSGQGILKGFDDFKRYAVDYVAAMKEWGWRHAIVECDIQRVLGVAETHRLREEVFEPSGLEVIYVWHVPEGEAGLAAMARRYKRIAVSIPEFRQVYGSGGFSDGGAVKKAMLHSLKVIRDSGGNPRVHLLGNTERSLIDAPGDSCDSTSWMSGGRFGMGLYFEPARQGIMSCSIYSPKWAAWRRWCEREFSSAFALMAKYWPKHSQFVYYGNAACGAIALLLMMERLTRTNIRLPVPTALPVRPVGQQAQEPGAEVVEG